MALACRQADELRSSESDSSIPEVDENTMIPEEQTGNEFKWILHLSIRNCVLCKFFSQILRQALIRSTTHRSRKYQKVKSEK